MPPRPVASFDEVPVGDVQEVGVVVVNDLYRFLGEQLAVLTHDVALKWIASV